MVSFSCMIDCTALMLSLGYTLLFLQIVSPIIYYPDLRGTGSPRCVPFLFSMRGKRAN